MVLAGDYIVRWVVRLYRCLCRTITIRLTFSQAAPPNTATRLSKGAFDLDPLNLSLPRRNRISEAKGSTISWNQAVPVRDGNRYTAISGSGHLFSNAGMLW